MDRRTFLAATAVAGCTPGTIARSGQLFTGAALAFGTTISVSLVHTDAALAEAAIGDALDQAASVDRLMSIYSPASQVFQLNRDGVFAQAHPHLLAVLGQARALSQLTSGAFDITVQPLWQAFRHAADHCGHGSHGGHGVHGNHAGLPSNAQRLQAMSEVRWRGVLVQGDMVRLARPGMAITLNGLAQGYAADMAMAAVRARGIGDALLDTGEFSARGAGVEARPWMLGVPDPRDAAVLAVRLRLQGRCVATSGDYACTFTPDFLHHHIFDPATGDSPPELASVTVLAPSAMLADGLATAFMVTGARKAHALAATLDGVDVMTINKRGVIWRSPGFPVVA